VEWLADKSLDSAANVARAILALQPNLIPGKILTRSLSEFNCEVFG
jgi:hypothetical protein